MSPRDTMPAAAPHLEAIDGGAAEAGLALLDRLDALRDLLACLSAGVRGPSSADVLQQMHLVCDAVEITRAIECSARRVLCGLVGLPSHASPMDVARAVGAAADEYADATVSPTANN